MTQSTMSKALITGATGAVGGEILKSLSGARGVECVAAVRDPQKRRRIEDSGASTVHFDFTDASSVADAVRGIDILFLATGYSVDMLAHSKLVLDRAKKAGVRHVVHLGAWGCDTSSYPHMMWHAFVEAYIERMDFGYTHLHPKTFMQNILNAFRPGTTVLRNFYGEARLGWVDLADVAAVAATVLADPERHDGHTYRLSSSAMTMAQVANEIASATGRPFTYEARELDRLIPTLLATGMETTYAHCLARRITAIREGRLEETDATSTDIEEVLGRPGTTWTDFAIRHAARFSERAAMSADKR